MAPSSLKTGETRPHLLSRQRTERENLLLRVRFCTSFLYLESVNGGANVITDDFLNRLGTGLIGLKTGKYL